MKKKVMMIQYPSISHLNGGFRIAEILQENNYEVFYFIDSTMASHVKSKGFNHYPAFSNPLVQRFDEKALKKEKISYSYIDRFRDNVLKVLFDDRKFELCEAVRKIEPEIIIADTFAGSDFVLLYPVLKERGIRFFYLETMLSSIEERNFPYLNSKSFPHESFKIPLEHLKRKYKRILKRIWMRFIYFGNDNVSAIKDEMIKLNLTSIYSLNDKNYFDLTFTNITTLVMAPLELEFFKTKQYSGQHYLGFTNIKIETNIEIEERLQKILKGDKKIIYISFGTVFGEKMYDEIANFMKLLNVVLNDYTNIAAIFSLGKIPWSSKDVNTLTNIYTFQFVPQTYVLKFCQLFITHGGLNSMKESIEAEVPMLAYPFDIDQIGNSRKIEHKKFGLFGNIISDSCSDIKCKLDDLLNNSIYKEQIRIFKNKLHGKYDMNRTLMTILETNGNVL